MGNTSGRILPPHASSLGKAITAFQPPEIAEKLVPSCGTHYFTPNTITDEIALRRISDDSRTRIRRGSGREHSGRTILCSAQAVGAVSLSMPMIRFRGEEQRKTVISAVRETAKAIEKRLG